MPKSVNNTTLLFVTLINLWILSPIYALYSDDYLLGTYELKNVKKAESSNVMVMAKMKEAHYNSVEVVNREHFYYDDLTYHIPYGKFLESLNANGIDAIQTDTYYPRYPLTPNSEIGIEFLTSSNYFRFEAEYGLAKTEVNKNDLNSDLFFYRFDREQGRVGEPNSNESNGRAWYCPSIPANTDHSWKLISGDLLRRWTGLPNKVKIDWLFNFAKHWDSEIHEKYLANNRLYIRIALKWDDIHNCEDSLISIQFKGLTVPQTGAGNVQLPSIMLHNLNFKSEGNYSNILKVSDRKQGAHAEIPSSDYRIFTYSIRLDSLNIPDAKVPGQTLLRDGFSMQYVVPYISWKQNHTVSIDYIEYEDTIHKKMRETPEVLDKWLKRRLDIADQTYLNTSYYWAIDEPPPGNYDSCRRVNDYIMSLKSNTKHQLVTNLNRWMAASKPDGESFSTVSLFNQLGKPSMLCVDPYPLDNDIVINGTTQTERNFVQKAIDSTVKVYETAKKTNVPFIAVTQSYGDWDPRRKEFYGKIYPPPAMQKCLQLLPLCYGASGIINFALKQDNPNLITPLNPDCSPNPNFYAIKEANDKILTYGPIVKKASWIGTDCIKPSVSYSEEFVKKGSVNFASVSMNGNDTGNKAASSNVYEGYIQCGYFHTELDNYYMFVNRRTEFLKPGLDVKTIDPSVYSSSYIQAASQTVKVTLLQNNQAIRQYGKWLGLYDPYSKDLQLFLKGKANIKLAAGDASLRQYVESLPQNVHSSVSINHFGVLPAKTEIHIKAGSTVTVESQATLKLLSKCIITVHRRGKLKILGTIEYEKGAKIKVKNGGKLEIANK